MRNARRTNVDCTSKTQKERAEALSSRRSSSFSLCWRCACGTPKLASGIGNLHAIHVHLTTAIPMAFLNPCISRPTCGAILCTYLQLRSMVYDGGGIVLANDTSPSLLILARRLPGLIDISSWVILELQEVQGVAQSHSISSMCKHASGLKRLAG